MIKLSTNSTVSLGDVSEAETGIRRISSNPDHPVPERTDEYFIVQNNHQQIPSGFAGYLFFEKPDQDVPANSFLVEPALSYLRHGDIIRINPTRNAIRTVYRRDSPHNALLVTERCNNFCLMCSQPPKEIDDSYIINDILRMIPLMSTETGAITITGGEPTLLGQSLITIVKTAEKHLPATALYILSNGRAFKEWDFAMALATGGHHDLTICIPVYSDISSIHDYVVQADGAFDDTIRGILNLKSVGVKVEIRVVIHKGTYQRLPDLARFIRRNLVFCDHIALMGLEMTGFTKINLDKLWIDPKDYQPQLREAVELLAQARMAVSIYNHQLCVLDPSLSHFSRKSISDWKNEYMPECSGCARMSDCGGFFSSARLRYSRHIKPFVTKG